MSDKKQFKETELGKVSGGAIAPNESISCPYCFHCTHHDYFSPEIKDSGCSSTITYTCPKCGKSWTV